MPEQEPSKKKPGRPAKKSKCDMAPQRVNIADMPRIQIGDKVRNPDGTFAPGHNITRWNHNASKPITPTYQDAFEKAVTEKDWIEIIQKAVAQAKEGDRNARQWISDYLAVPAAKLQAQQQKDVTINIAYIDSEIPDANKQYFTVDTTATETTQGSE